MSASSNRRNRRVFLRALFAVSLAVNMLGFTSHAHAQAWGTLDIFGDLMTNVVEVMQRLREGLTNGALKASAIAAANSAVADLVGGTSAGGALVISDWKGFLYDEPDEKVDVEMESFFASITDGKGSSANYTSLAVGTSPTLDENYAATLERAARLSVSDTAPNACPGLSSMPDFDRVLAGEAEGNVIQALNYSIMPSCNTIGIGMIAQEKKAAATERERNIKFVEAVSPGYQGKKDSLGNTILPAGNIKDIVSKSMTMGQDALTAIQNPAEFATVLAAAAINKAVSGIADKVQSKIQNEIGKVDRKIYGEFQKIDREFGPEAQAIREINQQINVNVTRPANSGSAVPNTRIDL